MPNLLSLPTELITLIGSFLRAGVLGLLRLVNKELHTKTWRSFCLRFQTVKVSLIRISVQALSDAASSPDIANEIKHMIIGTETLDQYEHAPTSYPRALRAMIATEGKAVDLRIWLQNIIVQKLPNLRTITLEDRPEDPDSKDYRPSMGSVELLRRAGVDLSLNGPYGLSIWDIPRRGDDRSFPLVSRLLVFATVFSMLRYLDTESMVMDFRIVIRGHRIRGQEESDIREAFDITDRCTKEVLDAHLTQITVGEDESRYLVTDRFLEFLQGLRDYAQGKGILLIERSADGQMPELTGDEGRSCYLNDLRCMILQGERILRELRLFATIGCLKFRTIGAYMPLNVLLMTKRHLCMRLCWFTTDIIARGSRWFMTRCGHQPGELFQFGLDFRMLLFEPFQCFLTPSG